MTSYTPARITLTNLYLDTRLADRTGRVETAAAAATKAQADPTPVSGTPKPPSQAQTNKKPAIKNPSQPQQQPPISLDVLSTARHELFEAQRSRAELQDQLAKKTSELDSLKKKFTAESKRMYSISADRTHLQIKLKDRDEELRGKAKLLDVSFFIPSFFFFGFGILGLASCFLCAWLISCHRMCKMSWCHLTSSLIWQRIGPRNSRKRTGSSLTGGWLVWERRLMQ